MAVEDTLLNLGVAGAVLFVFYRLISNELGELRKAISENTKALAELRIAVAELRATITRLNGER